MREREKEKKGVHTDLLFPEEGAASLQRSLFSFFFVLLRLTFYLLEGEREGREERERRKLEERKGEGVCVRRG